MSDRKKKKSLNRRGFGKTKRRPTAKPGRKKLPSKRRKVQKDLGKRIRGWRHGKGLDVIQMAKACGVPTAKIELIERGEVNITLVIIIRLAHALGMTVSEFLQGVD